jgi:hypothetical protein
MRSIMVRGPLRNFVNVAAEFVTVKSGTEASMGVRIAVLGLAMLAAASAAPASAQELGPDQARAFIAGKLFAYNCFDGTRGVGRIFADGSIIGTIQAPGSNTLRFAHLPPGTIRVTHTAMCAHLQGLPIDPCFRVQKIDYHSFRGSIAGLSFAYCDFRQRNPRAALTRRPQARESTAMAGIRPGP